MDIEELIRLAVRRGLRGPDAEDAAQEAALATWTRAPENPEGFAAKVIRNHASSRLRRRRPEEPADEEVLEAPPTDRPDVAVMDRVLAAEALRTVRFVEAAVEQVSFWGLAGATRASDPARSPQPEKILAELQFYQAILAADVAGYSTRQRRRQRDELLDNIRRAVTRLKRVVQPPPDLPVEPLSTFMTPKPRRVSRAGVVSSSLEDLEERVLCTRFDVRFLEFRNNEGELRRVGPLTMLWFGARGARGISAAEETALPWPGPLEYRCATDEDGLPICILGGLLWRGVEVARRLGPKMSDRQALDAALAARDAVGERDDLVG